MKLIKTKDGSTIEATIVPIRKVDYFTIRTSDQFDFDWNIERENMVFVLKSVENQLVLGVMSLIKFPKENRVHLNLIEVTKMQQGKNKEIKNIAGCLIAFACSISFSLNYFGFVSLESKTNLIDYYILEYGFKRYGKFLAVDSLDAILLINKYLNHE